MDREEKELPESRLTFRKMEPPLMLLRVGTQYPIILSMRTLNTSTDVYLLRKICSEYFFLLVLTCLAIVLEEQNLKNPFYPSNDPN